MDVVELTRKLGAEIQKDERYTDFMLAKQATDADAEIAELMNKLDGLRSSYGEASSKGTPSKEELRKFEEEFRKTSQQLTENPLMEKYEDARTALDDLMNYLMQILYLCVNGEDPYSCDPHAAESCGGECGSCAGCH